MSVSNNNSKLGNIGNYSLPPIQSCPNCKECAKFCYANKSYRQYPNVKKSWDENFEMAKRGDLENVREWFAKKKTPPKYFRIHVSGDFFNHAYVAEWMRIIKQNPQTKFLAFTKAWDNVLEFQFPKNFILYCSVTPTTVKTLPECRRTALVAYTGDADAFYDVEGIENDVFTCGGDCKVCNHCFEGKGSVHFPIH